MSEEDVPGESWVYEFGRFRLDPLARELRRGDEPIVLKPKVLDTLLVLVSADGRLLPRQELLDAVWPDVIVEPGNLDGNVAAIRRALGDDAGMIETQRGRGYRISVPVVRRPRTSPASPAPPDEDAPAARAALAPALPARIPRWRLLRRVQLLGLAALVAGLGTFIAVRASSGRNVRPELGPRRLAVLAPANLSGRAEEAWLASALRETLRTELSSIPGVETLPAEAVRRASVELELADAGSLSHDTLERFRKATGADLVVAGSYLSGGGNLRVDVAVQECQSGRELGAVSETGTVAGLLPLLAQTGGRLRSIVGAGKGRGVAAEGLPRSPEALRLYVEGLDRMASFETVAARDLLVEAVAAEPGSALIRATLAETWEQLGDPERALAEADAALARTEGLSRGARLAVEGRSLLAAERVDEAIARFRALVALHPESLEDGLLLAQALRRGRQWQGALQLLETLATLPPPAGTDPRIDLERSFAWTALGDQQKGLASAVKAEGAARDANLPLLLSQVLLAKGLAELGLEDDEAFRRSSTAGVALAQAYRDTSLEVRHLTSLGWALLNLGERENAAQALERGLELARKSGCRIRVRDILGALCHLRIWEGELDLARRLGAERAAIAKETHGTSIYVYTFIATSDLERLAGRFPEALAAGQTALALSVEAPGRKGEALRVLAEAELLLGHPEKALEHATAESEAYARSGPGARASALKLQARALLELGRPAEAERAAAESVRLLEPGKRPYLLGGGRAIWARTLASTGELAKARAVLSRERESWPRLAPSERLLARVEEARALLALGDTARGRSALSAIQKEAGETEMKGVALEAARALGGRPPAT